MESALNEEAEDQPLRKGLLLITMVSSKTQNVGEAINRLVTSNMHRLCQILDEKSSKIEK